MINQRKSCSKNLSKYVTAFNYTDKILIVLVTTISEVCIISFASVAGAPAGIASEKSYFNFFSNNRNNQKIIKHNKKQKEKAW